MKGHFLGRIISRPPVLFPAVALFHVLIFSYSLWNYSDFEFPSIYWTPVAWLLAYTLLWLFVCDLRRWAALGYLGLTTLHILLHFALSASEAATFTPSFMLVYILFSFFILFYYRIFH